jgi:uracil-DNA glycosylase family 4
MGADDSLDQLATEALACRRCPRLVRWLDEVARTRRAAFRDSTYWCRPVPSFGPARARLVIVGLAPGAHGANRTGRPFTGDGAGPFLYGALFRAGFASRPESVARDDGLRLIDARLTNAVRCAPPGNRPTPREIATCRSFLARELALLVRARVVLCLGEIAWKAVLGALEHNGVRLPRPRPRFAHAGEATLGRGVPRLLASYHPSQLNVNTGRLKPEMLDTVLARARSLLERRE